MKRQNSAILKQLKIAETGKVDLIQALRKYILAYYSPTHSITGQTPALLMLRRKNSDKIPDHKIIGKRTNIAATDYDFEIKER